MNPSQKRNTRVDLLIDFWRRFRQNKLALLGLIFLLGLIIVAIFADHIAPYDYMTQNLLNKLKEPGGVHLLGTDEFGRDIYSRIIYGARISIQVGFVSVVFALVTGGALGAIAGYFGGMVDNAIMRVMDVVLSIPQLILAIAISTALGNGINNLMLAVGLSAIPGYARIMRSSVLSAKEQEYVEAARLSGATDRRILLVHILPNCMAPMIVQGTLGVASAILTTSSLSFIGLGIEPPEPEWGSMLSSGRRYIRNDPHLTLFPGLAIGFTIFALNVLGDGLRDAFDPKQRKQ